MKSSKTFNLSYLKKLPIGLLALVLVFAGALFLFGFILHEVLWEKEVALDNFVFNFLSANVSPGRTLFMKRVTYFASSDFLRIGYGALAFLYLVLKNWKRLMEISVIALGGFLINFYMKIYFQRERPPGPLADPLHNFSFPSGHATSGFIFYGLLVYLIWKAKIPEAYKFLIGLMLILFAILIGFSRVYLRLHYTSDVLAGFCVGAAWLLLCIGLMEKLKKKSDAELTHTSQENISKI